jgi:4-hydroxy-tetrahydrodipicolinate synthase
MKKAHLISAIGTPLADDDTLHVDGLAAQLDLQWRNGIHGILVAGSMGVMQLLSDQTYGDLVRHGVELAAGRGEIMVGVGDTSFNRTRDRIHLVNQYRVDAVAVLTPYLLPYSQAELVDYFHALADESRAPIYLYDLPQTTGLKVEIDTVLAVCEHKNIHGIKCSDDIRETRVLIETLKTHSHDFRVIVAQPLLLDILVRGGIREHLDGMFALAPNWASSIVRHTQAGEHDKASACQRDLIELLTCMRRINVRGAFTELMNARGVPGRFAPRPFRMLTPQQAESLHGNPVVRKLLSGSAVPSQP